MQTGQDSDGNGWFWRNVYDACSDCVVVLALRELVAWEFSVRRSRGGRSAVYYQVMRWTDSMVYLVTVSNSVAIYCQPCYHGCFRTDEANLKGHHWITHPEFSGRSTDPEFSNHGLWGLKKEKKPSRPGRPRKTIIFPVKYCVIVLNYLFGVSKNSQLPFLASFLVWMALFAKKPGCRKSHVFFHYG